MKSIFDAIFYSHEQGVVHRNLKAENLLLTNTDLELGGLKVANFGLAHMHLKKTSIIVENPSYIAPEILTGKPYDERCDYWSLGVILFLLLSGTLPFDHEDTVELVKIIKKGKYNKRAESWRCFSA